MLLRTPLLHQHHVDLLRQQLQRPRFQEAIAANHTLQPTVVAAALLLPLLLLIPLLLLWQRARQQLHWLA
jgi:hypothetical protein